MVSSPGIGYHWNSCHLIGCEDPTHPHCSSPVVCWDRICGPLIGCKDPPALPRLWLADRKFTGILLAVSTLLPHCQLTLRILPTLPDRQRVIIMFIVRLSKWINWPSLLNLKKRWQGLVKPLIFNRNSWIINLYCRFHTACWSYLRLRSVRGT